MIALSCATATLRRSHTAGLSTQQWAIFDSYRPKCTEFIFAPKMLPSKRASSRSGTSCSSRFLESRRLPLGKVKPQL